MGVAAEHGVDAPGGVSELHRAHAPVREAALGLALQHLLVLVAQLRLVGKAGVHERKHDIRSFSANPLDLGTDHFVDGREGDPFQVLPERHVGGGLGDEPHYRDLDVLDLEEEARIDPVDGLLGLGVEDVLPQHREVGHFRQALGVLPTEVEIVVAEHTGRVADVVHPLEDRRPLGVGAERRPLEDVAVIEQEDGAPLPGRLVPHVLDVVGDARGAAERRREVRVQERGVVLGDMPVNVAGVEDVHLHHVASGGSPSQEEKTDQTERDPSLHRWLTSYSAGRAGAKLPGA